MRFPHRLHRTPGAGDERFDGGFWLLVSIDLSRLGNKAIRVNISLPEQLVHEIDRHARSRHMSRSAFLAAAAKKEMAAH